MSKDTGGPAYPNVSLYHEKDGTFTTQVDNPGMTLRDYFAAKALQGICASGPGVEFSNAGIAEEAFHLADAMIAERAK